ncbi:MAG: tRNA lysidine(34) synthetase TilS [Synechococcus sp.]
MQYAKLANDLLRLSVSTVVPLSDFHIRIHKAIKHHHLLPKGSNILIGVSGGQDSLCMMHVLNDLNILWNWKLHVLHCNHRWAASEADCADFVTQQANALQLPNDVATAPQIYRDENGARQWRYGIFCDWARQWNCQYVVTAHTGSDRAETFLFNLFRGSGADGLASLKRSRSLGPRVTPTDGALSNSKTTFEPDPQEGHEQPLMLVRPLLDAWRHETLDFCQNHSIPIWEDPFNQDFSHPRNRIRQELIPLLKEHFNPQVELALTRAAEILASQAEDVSERGEALMLHAYHEDPPRLDLRLLGKASVALQRQAIRLFLRMHAVSSQFEQVETLRYLLNAPHHSRTPSLTGGVWAEINHGYLVLCSEETTLFD